MSTKSGRREQRPWFQMYPSDFLSSSKVARMSAEERGVFITIMLRSWTDDGLELDEEDLADELDITVERLREILAGRVGRALYEDEEGRLRSKRLEEERALADAKAKTAAENGRKGGRPRKPKETQPVPEETQPLASGTQSGPSKTQSEVRLSEVRLSPSCEGGSGGAPPRGVGARLAKVLERELEPIPEQAMPLIVRLDRQTREARAESDRGMAPEMGEAAWRRHLAHARRDLPAFAAAVELTEERSAANLQVPEPGKPNGSAQAEKLTPRGAQQRRQDATIARMLEREQSEGLHDDNRPSPRRLAQ